MPGLGWGLSAGCGSGIFAGRLGGWVATRAQLPVEFFDNVFPCLALAAFSVQIVMLVKATWNLLNRYNYEIATAFQWHSCTRLTKLHRRIQQPYGLHNSLTVLRRSDIVIEAGE